MKLSRIIYCTIILGLAGCQGLLSQHNSQVVEQCGATCAQKLQFCSQNCPDSCANCTCVLQKMAGKNFQKYVYERKVEGKKVMRELNSYRDPLQCRKITCDCVADFVMCKKYCTHTTMTVFK
jgi:hypothetical protein